MRILFKFQVWYSSRISDSQENSLYAFADDSTLHRTISHPSDRQAGESSLSADLDKITGWSNTWNMSFNPNKSHSHHVSPKGPCEKFTLSNFSTIPLKKSSFNLLGLTICHDLSWESHISKLASKASHRLGTLCCAKSFLGTPELPTTNKAFICSLMEYCFPLRAGSPASHLA